MVEFCELKVDSDKLGRELCPDGMIFVELGNGDWAWIPKGMQHISVVLDENA